MKFRKNKIKKEHSIIKNLEALLLIISKWDEVISIIPGRIKPANKQHKLHLTVSYMTKTGIKCIAKGDGVQEVFIVSSSPEETKTKIKEMRDE
jgi:Predicted metal-binding protein (DUF2103)